MDIAIRTAPPVASFGPGLQQPHPETDARRVTPVESSRTRPDADSFEKPNGKSQRPPGTDPSLPPQTLIDAALIGEAYRPKLTVELPEPAPAPAETKRPAPQPSATTDPRDLKQPDEKTYMMVEKMA